MPIGDPGNESYQHLPGHPRDRIHLDAKPGGWLIPQHPQRTPMPLLVKAIFLRPDIATAVPDSICSCEVRVIFGCDTTVGNRRSAVPASP